LASVDNFMKKTKENKGMQSIDLSRLSLVELRQLSRELGGELKRKEEEEQRRVLEEMKRLAGSIGKTVEEVLRIEEEQKKKKKRRPPKDPQYRSTRDPNLTWSGRGKQPAWVKEELEEGRSLEELKVK